MRNTLNGSTPVQRHEKAPIISQDDDPVAALAEELRKEGFPLIATLGEAASAGRVAYQTAWAWAQCGKFPAFRRGGRWFVKRDDLARWILRDAGGRS